VRQPAQVLVVFAITVVSILTVVGLLYSFGLVLAQRRALQTAADASSLSGAWQVLRELASDNRADSAVVASVVQFATTNGVPTDGTVTDASYISAFYLDSSGSSIAPVGGGGTFPTQARGVLVTVKNQVPTVLPGFLKVWQVLVQDSASAVAKPTAAPVAAYAVLPIAILASDVRTTYTAHTSYDLFAHPVSVGHPPTLDLAASGAPTFGSPAANLQNWSDGQHTASWQLSQPGNVNLAGAAYYDSIAAGLLDNVRRQGLVDATSAAYALVMVPVYDTSTATTVHIVSFAQLKLRNADISSTSARGWFVPYTAAAWGTPVAPSTDLGAVLVALVP
jgi:Putative Flp pilus-assembly TadE/G-like